MTNMKDVPGLSYPDEDGLERILSRLKEATGSTSDRLLSAALGFKHAAVAAVRRRKQIHPSWIVEAVVRFGASATWLIFGTESGHIDEEYQLLPIISSSLTNGTQLDWGNIKGNFPFRREWLEAKAPVDDLVLLRTGDDSMEPIIHYNDLVLVDTSDTKPLPAAAIFAVAFNEAIFIKRICMEPGKIIMRSENSRVYPDVTVPLSDMGLVNILGRVIWWSHDETPLQKS